MSGDGNITYQCSHYKRKCKYVSPCCEKLYMCRVCHDSKEDHEMDRKLVTVVECIPCHKRQNFQKTCENCGIVFGEYCCLVCHLLDDTDKQQFHCDKCGICRVGGAENFFHCEKCDMCLGNELKDNHKCVEKVSHDVCPVCRDDLHTSRRQLHVLSCGHVLHQECFRSMMTAGVYACPNCGQSMVKMNTVWEAVDNEVANTEMPDEYKDMIVDILCKDCHKKSKVKFHVLGLKCTHCGSYNTCR